ncbi:MAG: phytanoyl-CoA dioxygenase family protein [Granulosicoccus sp.]|nr:phytanoyl-CoA dioxygenase family protein [Granulosicoccus sp.]
MWYNIAAHEHERPIDSEIWHRDNDDLNVLTLFLYLDDVSSENGPFSYIKKSQRGGKYDHIAPAVPPLGSYPSSEEIYPQIPVEQIIQCEGLRGTAILSDTSGLHLGGRVKSGSRLVLTARYVTNAGIDRYSYVCEPSSSNNSTPRERFLLS